MGRKILISSDAAATSDGIYLHSGDSICSTGLAGAETAAIESEVDSGDWEPVLDSLGDPVELSATNTSITINAYARYRVVLPNPAGTVKISANSPSI